MVETANAEDAEIIKAKILKDRESFYNGNDDDVALGTDDQAAAEDKAKKTRAKLLSTIERLSASLIKKRNLAVTARASSGIEQIWREDEQAFEGLDEIGLRARMIDYATQTAPLAANKGPKRSRVYINIVRPKCETAEGRFSDIQLPTDAKNWGLKRTPVPELVAQYDDTNPAQDEQGQPVPDQTGSSLTVAQIAFKANAEAEKKMLSMEKYIDDQLTECDYNGECRKGIRFAVRLGTAILKGPMVVKDLKKSWRKVTDKETGKSVHVFERKEDMKPSSKAKDPWDVFPDPDCKDDVRKAAYIWDREATLPRELRDLIGVDGYFTDQVLLVLQDQPTRVTIATEKDNQYLVRYNTQPLGTVYEKWEYNGDLDKDDLETLGCDCSDMQTKTIGACVVMVNDRPIKVMLNSLDTGELPYDFFQWTSRSGVPWGMGVARELSWQQRILVAAWRAMMDNAGDSSGANVVVGEGIKPMDGRWELAGKKIWRNTGEQMDVQKAFAQFQIENNQEELQRIIELALRFIDMETSLPMIFSGEKGELPKTLGATNIMVDSSNVALRTRVKLWDDRVTKPHMGRYYDWNMQYSENEEIKGDYNVDARGISVLLEADQQAQSIEELMSLRGDAEISIMVDWEKAVGKIFAARNLDVMLPSDKIKENRQKMADTEPQSDPGVEAAKIRSGAELERAKIVAEATRAEMEFKSREAGLSRKHEQQLKLMDRDIKAMELSASTGVALDKIKAQLTEVSAKLRTQVALATAKTQPAEQVAEPIVEPPGRAPEGEAFQK